MIKKRLRFKISVEKDIFLDVKETLAKINKKVFAPGKGPYPSPGFGFKEAERIDR